MLYPIDQECSGRSKLIGKADKKWEKCFARQAIFPDQGIEGNDL
jgi:hypothetical protein